MVLGLPLELWHSKDALGQGWTFEREVKHRRSLYSGVLIIVLDLSILGSADVRVPHGVYFCGVGVLDGVFQLPCANPLTRSPSPFCRHFFLAFSTFVPLDLPDLPDLPGPRPLSQDHVGCDCFANHMPGPSFGNDPLPCEAEIGIATILVADAGGAMFEPRYTCGALVSALQCGGHPVPRAPCTAQSAGRFQCLSPLQALPPVLGEDSLSPCSTEVAPEGLASSDQSSGLAYIEKILFLCLECAIRSFLLFYFLAVGNLFARGCKLQADRPRINGVITRARRCLHGAPVCLALALVAHQMPVCGAMTWPHDLDGSSPIASGLMPDVVATDARRARLEAAVVETSRTRNAGAWAPKSGDDDLFITATFFSFQASVTYVNAWVGPHEDIQYTCRMLQDEIYDAAAPARVIPVFPQPAARQLVLLDVPQWITDQLLVPILIEIDTSPVVRYLEIFTGRVTLDELRHSVGKLWIPGGQFFVADSECCLAEGEIVQLRPGMLVRLRQPHRPFGACLTLEQKLEKPRLHFDDASIDEVHEVWGASPYIGLVGQWGDWETIRTDASMRPAQLREAISSECGIPADDLIVVAPDKQPPDLCFRGTQVPSVLAVMPKSLEGCRVIFLDARDLGLPIRALHLPPLFTTVGAVLRLAGGSRPHNAPISIYGASDFESDTETFMPVHKALIRVTVDVDLMRSRDESGPDLLFAPGRRGLGHPLTGDSLPSSVRMSSLPRAIMSPHASEAAICAAEQTDLQFRWRYLTGQSSAVLSEAPDPRLEGPLPERGLTPADEADAEDDPASDADEALESGSDALPEWRLRINVFQFQVRVCNRVLFVARHESFESFIRRAEILLKPDEDAWDLFVPNPQPRGDRLAVILAPSWWARTGANAVLVADPTNPQLHFVSVSYGDTPAQEILPPDFAQIGDGCRVSLFSSTEPQQMCAAPGDLVILHSAEQPEGLPSVQSILSNPAIEVSPSDAHNPPVQDCRRLALLGVEFEQSVLSFGAGDIAMQIGGLLEVSPASLHLWYQTTPFDDLAIFGQPVERCVGYRHKHMHEVGSGVAIFIDARALGLPVCCRWMRDALCGGDVLANAIGFTVPAGFVLRFRGGRGVAGDDRRLRFDHCGSVVLWLEQCAAYEGIESGAEPLGDTLFDEEDDGSDASAGPPHRGPRSSGRGRPQSRHGDRNRSRSPRAVGNLPGLGSGKGPIAAAFVGLSLRGVPTPCRNAITERNPGGPGRLPCDESHPFNSRFLQRWA